MDKADTKYLAIGEEKKIPGEENLGKAPTDPDCPSHTY